MPPLMRRMLLGSVENAMKDPDPLSPWIAISDTISSVWRPFPAAVWITPLLLKRRVAPLSLYPLVEALLKVIPPTLRLASTVIVEAEVGVVENVATSAFAMPLVAPGTAPLFQFPAVSQLPPVTDDQNESPPWAGLGERSVKMATESGLAGRRQLSFMVRSISVEWGWGEMDQFGQHEHGEAGVHA